jgi:pyruvate dehydrogenase E2 component (dihydrolipoamide acetyltransferase)
VDVEKLIEAKQEIEAGSIKLTFNDFVIRAVALALREHPIVNSGFDAERNVILQYGQVDISVAVSLPQGLITPIVRNVDHKGLKEISREVKELVEKAKLGKLQLEEFQGGSFTVSNLGMFGVSDFTGIINPPQCAILAVGGIRSIPVVREGKVVPGKVMRMTLSSDHRVIDGVAGALFINSVKNYLENPALLLV